MVLTSSSMRSFGLLTAFLALAFMASGTGVAQAGELQSHDSLLSAAGVKIAMSPQEKKDHAINIPPKKRGKKPRLTKKQKLDICARNPQCRASLDAANKGKRPKPIPAVIPGSPEDKMHKSPHPPKAKKPQGKRSELQPEPSSSLLSWLNPFSVSVAEAQTAPPGFPKRAETPHYIAPGLQVRNYGGMTFNGYYYLKSNWPGPSGAVTGNNGKNYMPFHFTAPVQGYYIIDVEGTPARAHVNIPYNTSKPYDYPDFSTRPAGSEQHYVSVHYLAAGGHWFYFWLNTGVSARFDAVEVDFYRY